MLAENHIPNELRRVVHESRCRHLRNDTLIGPNHAAFSTGSGVFGHDFQGFSSEFAPTAKDKEHTTGATSLSSCGWLPASSPPIFLFRVRREMLLSLLCFEFFSPNP